jgi:hypothetical protein
MRIILILAAMALTLNQLMAQLEFAPIGAEWFYTAPYNGKCIKLMSTKDTVINSENFRIVEFRYCENDILISNEYFKQHGDSVFYYNYFSESTHLLYDFSAKAGDTIFVNNTDFQPTKGFYDYYNYYHGSISHFSYVIEAVDSIQVSDIWLKRQKVSGVLNSPVAFPPGPSYLIERLGSSQYPFGRFNGITLNNDYIGMLRCYSDTEFEYKNPEWNAPCNFSTNVESFLEQQIKIYPNPVNTGSFKIISKTCIEIIEIHNLQGGLMYTNKPSNNSTTINTSKFPNGLYLTSIKIEGIDWPINKKFLIE